MTVLAGISKRKRYGSLSSLNSDISISALSRSLKMSLTRLRDHRRWATPFAHPSVRPSVVWKMTIRVPGDRRNISFVLEIVLGQILHQTLRRHRPITMTLWDMSKLPPKYASMLMQNKCQQVGMMCCISNSHCMHKGSGGFF